MPTRLGQGQRLRVDFNRFSQCRSFRAVAWVVIVALLCIDFPVVATRQALAATTASALSIGNYTLVSSTRVTRTQFEYLYRAAIINTESIAVPGVTATLTSKNPATAVIDNILTFGEIPAGAGLQGSVPVQSLDTFTFRQDRAIPFNPADLVWTLNRHPEADAGADKTAKVNETVQLDGSTSSDLDGDELTFRWTVIAKPAASGASLVSPTTIQPALRIDLPGTYEIQLIVNDGSIDSVPDTVKISTENSAPTANAGPDQTVQLNSEVTLSGSGSKDPDNDPLSYQWTLVTFPQGSLAELKNPTTVSPSFTADKSGAYHVRLVVSDGKVSSTEDIVIISTENSAPVADAGPDLASTVNKPIQLDGSASKDADGNTLSYQWSFVSVPDTSNAVLSDPTIVNPQFTPDVAGMYVVQLVVNDGKVSSAPDSAKVTVTVGGGGTGCTPGATQACYTGPANTQGVGICKAGTQTCGGNGVFGACTGQVLPGTEVPNNGIDEDCSGADQTTGDPLPPDPATIAPQVNQTVTTTVGAATAFLYTGTNPIQTGVAQGTIDTRRAAVIRGKVLDRTNTPLPGVKITTLYHPEFGQTASRADGVFDLAVNGGGLLTITYEKAGFLTAQRQVTVPWQGYAVAPDVVLIAKDSKVTTINLSASTMQVAQGNPVTDRDGARTATVLIPQGTQAQILLPNGSTQPVSMLNLRLTEYTVGENGPQAMPAPLPPTSGYTYAVELSADEAVAKINGKDVLFSQPVYFYVENFLNFPTGMAVPTGYYDKDKGVWVPSDNGRVIKIIRITGGVADLDTNGDGAADNDATLGITEAERQRVASLYVVGQSLWRVPISHFSTWDCNWSAGPPAGAQAPANSGPIGDEKTDCGATVSGSIIGCQDQTLGEAVGISGVPFALHYISDRVPGRSAARSMRIPLSGATLPPNVKSIALEILIGGQKVTQSFPPTTNQSTSFPWDGKDVYGRPLQGGQTATVRVGYLYDAVYYEPAQRRQSFAAFSGIPITGNRARQEVTLWQETPVALASWNNVTAAIGGWSPTVYHVYDPLAQVLYLGDGTRRSSVNAFGSVVSTFAGTGLAGFSGDGGPATEARLSTPFGMAVGPDGHVYIVDSNNSRIRKVDSSGNITTVELGRLFDPHDVDFGPDGSLYIADRGNGTILRRDPAGTVTTIAGTGASGFSGDGGPATQAQLSLSQGVAVGPDGSVYIADGNNDRIRRVDPAGMISTVAGTGVGGFSGDGGPATQAQLRTPHAVAVGPDGSLYVADADNHRIRRVDPTGIITTVAGSTIGFSGDGGPATQARLNTPLSVILGPDGSLYIGDANNDVVRRVDSSGTISTVAGTRSGGVTRDGGAATQTRLNGPHDVVFGPDGSLYITEYSGQRVRKVASTLPGLGGASLSIPSRDGLELYQFDPNGRHLKTLHALTGATLYEFGYDGVGRLTQIRDGNNNLTTIERDGSDHPTALIGPFGQRTALSVQSGGYLASIANPAGETHSFTYAEGGLLASMRDPKGNQYRFTYDALGRLAKDEDPAGGSQMLNRADLGSAGFTDGTFGTSHEVTRTTGLGRATRYRVGFPDSGPLAAEKVREIRTTTYPDGTRHIVRDHLDGITGSEAPDKTTSVMEQQPDPRFGMLAPFLSASEVTTPGRLTLTTTATRTAVLTSPANVGGLTSQTDSITVNGRRYANAYDAATRTFTSTTPTGRQSTTTIDALGRISSVQVPGLAANSFQYDARGRLTGISQGGRSVTYGYDSSGYLISATDSLGRVSRFQNDAVGRILTQTLPDNRIISYTYDANGNLTSLTPPGRPAHVFNFTPVDLQSVFSSPAVSGGGTNQTTYTYNADKELTLVTRPDGKTVQFSYDGAGRLSSQAIGQGSYGYSYDAATGNLSGISAPGSGTLAYTYDGSLLTGTTWTGTVAGSVTRTYDRDFRVTSTRVNGSNTVNFRYDTDSLLTAAGNLTLTRDPQNGLVTGSSIGGVTDTISYNALAEPTSYSATHNGTTLYGATYTRDGIGRITTKTETLSGVATTFAYVYDTAGRLTEVKQNGAVTAAYTYDANGNRLTAPNLNVPPTYDSQDRLLQYGNSTFTYTPNGELLTRTSGGQTATYNYDELGNLLSITGLPGGTIEYVSDGQNRRIGKKVNGQLVQGFLYEGQLRPITELNGSGAVVSRFVYATGVNVPDYIVKGSATYRIITDHLGSPRLVVNITTGAIAQRMDYDEFGNVLADTNPGFQPFGFAGGLYDQQTKLTRFGARDYDASTGRWTAKDPIDFTGGDTNLYGYVLNDPVNEIDPTGEFGLGGALVGAGIDLAFQFATNGFNWHCYNLTSIGVSAAMGAIGAVGWSKLADRGLKLGMSRVNIAFPKGLERIERSHFWPERWGGTFSKYNIKMMWGSEHALADASRYRFLPKWWKNENPLSNPLTRFWNRIPDWLKGATSGGGFGTALGSSGYCSCQ